LPSRRVVLGRGAAVAVPLVLLLALDLRGLSIGPESKKDRMAEPAVLRPLGEANLANQLRLHPMILAPVGSRLAGRRLLTRERLQLLPDRIQERIVESAPHARDVTEGAALIDSDVERPEATARSRRPAVSSDHEFLAALALDLHPVGGPLPDVAAIGALRD